MQALTNGETELDDRFFDRRSKTTLYMKLLSFWNFNSAGVGYSDINNINYLNESNTFSHNGPGIFGSDNALGCIGATGSQYMFNSSMQGFDFGNTQDFTIAFWAKRSSVNALMNVLFELQSNSGDLIQVSEDAAGSLYVQAGAETTTVSGAFVDGQWKHIAILFDRSQGIEVCIDGSCLGNNSSASTANLDSPMTMHVCMNVASDKSPFQGDIDSLGFWSRLLSQEEIMKLSNNENSLD